jgi:hypothetical protein
MVDRNAARAKGRKAENRCSLSGQASILSRGGIVAGSVFKKKKKANTNTRPIITAGKAARKKRMLNQRSSISPSPRNLEKRPKAAEVR